MKKVQVFWTTIEGHSAVIEVDDEVFAQGGIDRDLLANAVSQVEDEEETYNGITDRVIETYEVLS